MSERLDKLEALAAEINVRLDEYLGTKKAAQGSV